MNNTKGDAPLDPHTATELAYHNGWKDGFEKGKAIGNQNILYSPTPAQDCLNILIEAFLGSDWHVSLSMNQEQVNTVALIRILQTTRYGKRMLKKQFGKALKL